MRKIYCFAGLSALVVFFSCTAVNTGASAAEVSATGRAACVDRTLARPTYFAGPIETKRTPTGRVGVRGSHIGRSFGWNGRTFLWTGTYEWNFSYRLRGDDECAKTFRRASWSRVVWFVDPRIPGQKRRWQTDWSANLVSTLSEDYWDPANAYGLWTGTRSRSMPGQRIAKVRRASVTIKLQLIRTSDDKVVSTKFHTARVHLINDFCSGPRGYAGGLVIGRPSCAKKYPGYDTGGKTPRLRAGVEG